MAYFLYIRDFPAFFRQGYVYPFGLIFVLDALALLTLPLPVLHWAYKAIFVASYAVALHAKRGVRLPDFPKHELPSYVKFAMRYTAVCGVILALFYPGSSMAILKASQGTRFSGVFESALLCHIVGIAWTYDALDFKAISPRNFFYEPSSTVTKASSTSERE